jgi:hypothetical protein
LVMRIDLRGPRAHRSTRAMTAARTFDAFSFDG